MIGNKVVVHTDHSAIKYLMTKKDAKPRLIRWVLLLQEFDVEIKDNKDTENLVADHLSRLEGASDEVQVNDDFPDEKLLAINDEDVLVKVDKFIFPTDFIILDMQEGKEVPIILGRPFLATGRVMIDVQKGELKLRVQEEEVTFNVFNAIKHPQDNDSYFIVDVLEAIVPSQLGHSEPLETILTHDDPSSCEDETI